MLKIMEKENVPVPERMWLHKKTRRQMFRERHPALGRRPQKAITPAAAIVMVCTCCAEVYTPTKIVLFGLSAAWVAGFLIANGK